MQTTHFGQRCAAVALALTLLGFSVAAQEEGDGQPRIEAAHSTLDRWVETQRLISKEKADWALGKSMLEDRIAVVRRELEALRTRIDDARDSISDTDESRASLSVESERLKTAAWSLRATVQIHEERVKSLLPRLPDPLLDRLQVLRQRLPQDSSDSKLSLSERFMNVVGILNEAAKFNREIVTTNEVKMLADGRSVEVGAIYLGVGQAYYVTANGSAAGIGSVGENKWEWRPADECAADIARAIAIYNNEQPAAFVRLPVRID